MTPRYLLFTDLDGTLLDHDTYLPDAARPGLELAGRHAMPIVFCSAKTRSEQRALRAELGIRDPFIVENGGAVFSEAGYFREAPGFREGPDGLQVRELGRSHAEIRAILEEARGELGLPLRGFADLTSEEVAEATGLSREAAERARRREYSETLATPLNSDERTRLATALSRHGLRLTQGARFLSVSAGNDKGQAARWLADAFRSEFGEVVTVGIGDSWNDRSLLAAVDVALLVQRPGGRWEDLALERVRRVRGIGPEGWSRAVGELLDGGGPGAVR